MVMSVDPGDVAEIAAQAFDLADHAGLAGLEIDRVERAAGHQPGVVLVLAGRDDVEADGPLTGIPSGPTVLSTPSFGGAWVTSAPVAASML